MRSEKRRACLIIALSRRKNREGVRRAAIICQVAVLKAARGRRSTELYKLFWRACAGLQRGVQKGVYVCEGGATALGCHIS